MKKRNLIIASILAGTIGVAGAVQAFGSHDGGDRCNYKGEHRGDRMMYIMKELDLSDEQRQSVREIKKQNREQMKNNREQMMEIRKELREASSADNYDAAKVRELADKKAKLMADMTVKRVEIMQRIRSELTPEQQREFAKMKEHRSDREGYDD